MLKRIIVCSRQIALSVFSLLGICAESIYASEVSPGRHLYESYCIVCHGEDGAGAMPGVRDLSGVKGPLAKPNDVLLRTMREGITSPESGMAMPPKGGNPALTDQDLEQLLNYMRSTFGK